MHPRAQPRRGAALPATVALRTSAIVFILAPVLGSFGKKLVRNCEQGTYFRLRCRAAGAGGALSTAGQLVFVGDNGGAFFALDATTGKTLWQGRLGVARREGFSASPVAVDGKIFFTNDDGETFVLRAGATFELLHVNDIGERTIASPALADGRWYIRTDRNLYAIGR